ncbi:CopL family metal-binding regulatory protein [Xanthomonas arboricola]|uniref:CopL family metal-binding regulatory protein n=1 Tax=Xanthomonas arboricola TaxID=56448 RepID=UPI00118730E2
MIRSVFLRVLLSLLVFNGIGGAYAGAQMQSQHGPASRQSMTAEAFAGVPLGMWECDGAERMKPPPSTGDLASPSETPQACCADRACECACAQQCLVMIDMALIGSLHVGHAAALHPLLVGHAAPTLASPIRPPIS